jgi:signal transduction histidine kinase
LTRLRKVTSELSAAQSVNRSSGQSCVEKADATEPDLAAVPEAQAAEAAAAMRASAAVLRRAALVVGEFAALVAHETNQPISAVLLNCSAARNHLCDPTPDLTRVRESIERIERDAKRAGAIIQRIRSLMTDTPPEYTAIDLNRLIEETLCLLDHELGRAGVVVVKALHPDLPLVFGDRVQLEQVLINLYSNAIEAMQATSGGTRVLKVSSGLEGGQPCVAVRDTGPGVEPQALGRLFDPLFTTKAGGIGLGLSISRSIVEAHGGRLWTTDGETPGACFCLTLHTAFEQAQAGALRSDGARLSASDLVAAAVQERGFHSAPSA